MSDVQSPSSRSSDTAMGLLWLRLLLLRLLLRLCGLLRLLLLLLHFVQSVVEKHVVCGYESALDAECRVATAVL